MNPETRRATGEEMSATVSVDIPEKPAVMCPDDFMVRKPEKNKNTYVYASKRYRYKVSKSCRSQGRGIETSDGQLQSSHDIKCLQIMGCDIEKLSKSLKNS